MSFFNRPHYTSEITSFIETLKAKKPTLEVEQRAGRAIWWDKKINLADEADYSESRIGQQPYVYGSSSHPNGK